MPTTPHSFYVVECSAFPPMHISLQHVYSEPAHVRLVLEDIVARMPHTIRGADLFALWIVQRGRVTRVVDLRPFFHLAGEESEEESEGDEPGAVEWSWDEIARELAALEPPLLAQGEAAIACWDDAALGFDEAKESPLFELGQPCELRLGSIEAGETGEDVTPPALQTLFEGDLEEHALG